MPKKIERRDLAPAPGLQRESTISTAIERLNASEPAGGVKKLSVSLPHALRREVRQIAFDCDCSETSVVEIALRRLLEVPDARSILLSRGSRYRRS
jgi:hypothetical protein